MEMVIKIWIQDVFWTKLMIKLANGLNLRGLIKREVWDKSYIFVWRVTHDSWIGQQPFAQSCLTLCKPMLPCPWNPPGKNTGVGCHFLLQGIFPTQGLNPGLLHCRQILYHLSHKGSPPLMGRTIKWESNLRRNCFGQGNWEFHFSYVKFKLFFRIQVEISYRYLRIRSRICKLELWAELWAGDV